MIVPEIILALLVIGFIEAVYVFIVKKAGTDAEKWGRLSKWFAEWLAKQNIIIKSIFIAPFLAGTLILGGIIKLWPVLLISFILIFLTYLIG